MNTLRIYSIEEIKTIIKSVEDERFLSGQAFMEFFRGHSLVSYKLLPGLLRYGKTISELGRIESILIKRLHEEYENGNISLQQSFLKDKYFLSDIWFRLFQAQHLVSCHI